MLISDKIDFKSKTVTRNKGHYIFIKVSIYQEDIIINICVLNIRATKHMKQPLTDLQGEIDISTIIVVDLNTSHSEPG